MAIAKCVFCGRTQEDYKGVYLLKNEGVAQYYCSNKCRKNNLKLKRDRVKMRWTEAFHLMRQKHLKELETKKAHEKEIVQEVAKKPETAKVPKKK